MSNMNTSPWNRGFILMLFHFQCFFKLLLSSSLEISIHFSLWKIEISLVYYKNLVVLHSPFLNSQNCLNFQLFLHHFYSFGNRNAEVTFLLNEIISHLFYASYSFFLKDFFFNFQLFWCSFSHSNLKFPLEKTPNHNKTSSSQLCLDHIHHSPGPSNLNCFSLMNTILTWFFSHFLVHSNLVSLCFFVNVSSSIWHVKHSFQSSNMDVHLTILHYFIYHQFLHFIFLLFFFPNLPLPAFLLFLPLIIIFHHIWWAFKKFSASSRKKSHSWTFLLWHCTTTSYKTKKSELVFPVLLVVVLYHTTKIFSNTLLSGWGLELFQWL